MICDWPSTTVPSAAARGASAASATTGSDLAAHRQDAVHPPDASSKSPPSIAVIAAISRLPDRVAAETAGRPGRPSSAREAVLEQLAHQRLRVGERDDAVADVADRRDPQLLAQDAGRAAVVGDGDDRGQVARVLLEPAQERREPGSATDRDDPRPAGEEPLLVDDLDQRLVASPVRNGSVSARTSRYAPTATSSDARPTPTMSPRSANGRNWSVSEVDERAGEARPAPAPGSSWRRTWAPASGEQRAGRRTRPAASA